MEWVETTGRTLADAKDAALDQLGVDEDDAEFVVVSEPKVGLFGRTRGEARVRARVRPMQARPKRGRERRAANGRSRGGSGAGRGASGGRHEEGGRGEAAADGAGTDDGSAEVEQAAGSRSERSRSRGGRSAAGGTAQGGARSKGGGGRTGEGRSAAGAAGRSGVGAGEGAAAAGADASGTEGSETSSESGDASGESGSSRGCRGRGGSRAGQGPAEGADSGATSGQAGAAEGPEANGDAQDAVRAGPAGGRQAGGSATQAVPASRPLARRSSSPAPAAGGSGSSAAVAVDEDEEASPGGAEKEGSVAEMTLQEQGDAARTFVEGLVDRLGLQASVEVRETGEDTVSVAVEGEGLGTLVGPGGTTLAALQELTRTYVQKITGGQSDRILVDVAGYRAKRVDALQRFARSVAAEVVASGQPKALEPMSAADRKVVHDSVNEIEGVATRSEGEEPRRHIVIVPAGGEGDHA